MCKELKVKVLYIALSGKLIAETWSIKCPVESHSDTCHPTQPNAPRLNTSYTG